MQASFRTGQSAQFGKPVEIEIQSATGVRKAITQTSFPIKTDKGYRLGAIVHDITDRKRAEETLRLQSAALNATANAIVITDRTRHVQWSNPAFTALTGYTAEETAGRDLRELVRSDIHDQAFYAEHDQTIDAGQAWHGEIVNRRKDGRLYTEEQTITPVRDADGTVTHMIAIKQDISDRKQREREMEAIALMATALRAAPDRGEMLPVIVHQVANLLKTDAALLHTVDPATGDAIIAFGHGLGADWTGGHIPRGSGIVGHVIATRRPYLTNDVGHEPHNFRPDLIGELGAIACVPLIAQDHIIGALWVGRKTTIVEDEVRLLTAIADIAANALQRAQIVETLEQRVADRTHDLAAANDQLAAANTRLQELDRLKSKFVSDVSHELRTPITALSLNVDLLEYGKPEKREQYMHVIRQQVRRVVQLIEDILNLSRLELGADKVRFGSVALNSLTAQVVAVHQPTAEAKNLTLTFAPYADLPAVRGEESQLAQVITNLIGNAINYTPAGEIHVRTAASDHEVLIEVRDTGLGIAPDDLPHLFERFYRGSRTRQIRGTGLGLAIAMEIVELHDGRIEVESEAGVGTTFRVYLPAHEPIG
jgi:PAS domain S-box-containing protein